MRPQGQEVERANERFKAWLRWYIEAHPDVAGNSAALARKLGISKPAMHHLLKTDDRSPSFATLIAARQLIGYPLDVLLFCDPPSSVPSGKHEKKAGSPRECLPDFKGSGRP